MTKMLKLASLSGVALGILTTVAVAADLPSRTRARRRTSAAAAGVHLDGLLRRSQCRRDVQRLQQQQQQFRRGGTTARRTTRSASSAAPRSATTGRPARSSSASRLTSTATRASAATTTRSASAAATAARGFLGTVRGRVGFLATPTFLIYATGGLAYGNTWARNGNGPLGLGFAGFVNGNNNSNSVTAGWTAGGGLEWMFSPNWSVKAEYLYVDLGRQNNTWLNSWGNASKSTAHVARLGVNYHFNWGASAPVVARY